MREKRTPPQGMLDFICVADNGCWEWQLGLTKGGYGTYRNTTAHRWVYEQLVGSIPAGLQLDHLCRVRHCVNPDHVEPVTPRENLMRGETLTAARAVQTHCIHGHEFTLENTRVKPNGCRECKTCHRNQSREYGRRKRRAQPFKQRPPRQDDVRAERLLPILANLDCATTHQLMAITGWDLRQVQRALRLLRNRDQAESFAFEHRQTPGRPRLFWRTAHQDIA